MPADLGMKPTLATFPFRTQPEELPPVTALHTAENGDDALLALVESQAEVATMKYKAGGHVQAVQILHRAYSVVEGYTQSFPSADPVPPAAMLAAATIRLTLCVVLSSMGRHKQALDEAKMAAVEMDKVWRQLFMASAEQEEATADGDTLRPAAPLRNALRNPPQWLERAVEVAVQARHCIAIELEYEARQRRRMVKTHDSLDCGAKSTSPVVLDKKGESGNLAEPSKDDVADPVPVSEALSLQEQIGALHREGVHLARQLLPAGHLVRNRAEVALDEWLARTGGDGQPNLPSSDGAPARPTSSRRKLAQMKSKSEPGAPSPRRAGSPSPRVGHLSPRAPSQAPAMASSFSAPSLGEVGLPPITCLQVKGRLPPRSINASTSVGSLGVPGASEASTRLQDSMSFGPSSLSQPSFESASREDLKHPTVQGSRNPSKTRTRAGSKESEQSQTNLEGRVRVSKTPQQRAKEAALLLERKNPFEHWRRNMVNVEKMTPFQRQLKTNEGQQALQADQKAKAHNFKHFELKQIDSDALFDYRILFTEFGMKIKQQAEKRNDKMNNWQTTQEAQQKMEPRPDLYHYFNMPCPTGQPSMSTMGKLLQKSHTHGTDLTKLAREEEQRQIGVRRRLRAMKVGGDGGMKSSREGGAKASGKKAKASATKLLS